MRIVVPMVTMLIAGLALGYGSSTLLWSSKLDRGFAREAQWKAMVDKQSAVMTDQSNTIREQSAALKRLIAATDGLVQETGNRH